MRINLLIVVLISFLFTGCLPHTRAYLPVSSSEKQALDRANRNVYPDDVRNSLANYQNTLVVWPGIVLENKFIEHADQIEIQLILEHHYYDWFEDFSIQKEKIFLSPRGEGLFQTSLFIKKDANIEEMKKAAGVGNLIIVYGTPQQIKEDRSINLIYTYLRGIDKQWFTTIDICISNRNKLNWFHETPWDPSTA